MNYRTLTNTEKLYTLITWPYREYRRWRWHRKFGNSRVIKIGTNDIHWKADGTGVQKKTVRYIGPQKLIKREL